MADTKIGTLAEASPEYAGRMHYIEGYDPVSYAAPHSSLNTNSTWIGMGMVVAGLCPAGILIYVAALAIYGHMGLADVPLTLITVIAAVALVICWAGGAFLINYGRRHYYQYRKETGRKN